MEVIGQVEKSLIGALLQSQKKIADVIDIVRAEDFITPDGREAYAAIVGMWRNKKTVNLVTVGASNNGLIRYLSSSMQDAFSPGAVDYARQISKEAKRRRVFSGINNILSSKKEVSLALDDMLSLYQKEMAVGKKSPEIDAVLKRFQSHVDSNKKNGTMGIETGFDFLGNLYVSYVPGHVWTIGGFTSVGKTAVMTQKICNLLVSGNKSIVVISTEMTEEQMVARIIANITGVHSYRVLSGNMHSAEEENAVEVCKSSLKKANIKIYDDIYTLGEIETAFRKADLQGGVDVGFIDYVQNVRVPEAKSQYQEQSEIAKRVQQMAKDVRATVICLSQVSNSVGRGETDNLELKGAGDWAAVSDVGVMLSRHKTEKYKLRYEIKKNRHGSLGEAILEYRQEYTRLEEIG